MKMEDALGYYTDLMFLELDGEISEIPNGLKVESPNNPTYFFGNFLLLDEAPESDDLGKLEKVFSNLFIGEKIKHFTFCWKGKVKNSWSKFIEAGYEYDETSILTLRDKELIQPKKINESITIKPFMTEKDWEEWVDLEVEERDKSSHEESGYRIYQKEKVRPYQELVTLDRGNYYGAYIDDELVAAAGLFYKEDIGRFQSVLTKTSFRRQGICKTLIFELSRMYLGKLRTLVIAADDDYFAKNIYLQLGFQEREMQSSLCWWKKTVQK